MPPKHRDIGWGIGNIFGGAVEGHQAQAKQEGTARVGRGNRLADLLEQGHDGRCPELGAAIGECTVAGQGQAGVGPDEAQASRELAQDTSNRHGGVKMERNDEPDGERQCQFAMALGSEGVVGEGGGDGALRNSAVQRLDGQGLAELAFGVNLSYRESHEVTPV